MKQWLACAVSLAAILALSCLAGQPPLVPPPTGPNDNEMLREWLIQLKEKGIKETDEGTGTVPARLARLCGICLKPLYKHSDDDFDGCFPPDKKLLQVKLAKGVCPCCGAKLNGVLRCNVNDDGGRDRDFCLHSVGKYTIHSTVWLCPDCGYAAPAGEFTDPATPALDAETKNFVREKLTESARQRLVTVTGLNRHNNQDIPQDLLHFSVYVQQSEIPDWMKYDHVLQLYARARVPHTQLSSIYLEAAHACRREVCSEVAAPALHNALQVALGESIRRVNGFIQREALEIRRQRGDNLVNFVKAETDPQVLQPAIARVIKLGKELQNEQPTAEQHRNADYIRAGDMFVLYLRYAGVLDRVGRIDDAEKAFDEALRYVPERAQLNGTPEDAKAIGDYYERQLRQLRCIPIDRKECLKREREYLFQAAKSNMAAIKFNEVKFKPLGALDQKGLCDPAVSAYLLGEFLRRAGAPAEAAVWLDSAVLILARTLEAVDAAEKAKTMPTEQAQAERERYRDLKNWAQQQRALIKTQEKPNDFVQGVSAIVLAAAGVQPGVTAVEPTPDPQDPKNLEPKTPATPRQSVVPPTPQNIKTRAALYKMYYEALLKFRKDKNASPRKLKELVTGGYVAAEDSCLDDNGRLYCPETQEKLGYSISWEPGDRAAAIVFPLKPGSRSLYANGEIREPPKK